MTEKVKKSELIGVSVTPEQKEAFAAAALAEGIKVTEWLRRAGETVLSGGAISRGYLTGLSTESPDRTSSVPEIVEGTITVDRNLRVRRTSKIELGLELTKAPKNELRQVSKPAPRTYARDEQGCAHAFRTPAGRCIACGNLRK